MGFFSSLISGASGLASGALGIGTAALNNYYSKKAWRRMMEASNTAHQREVRDLRSAGLNPILSAGGNGLSTPNYDTPSTDLTGAVDSAISAYSAKKSVDNQEKQADAALESAEAAKTNSQAQKKNAETNQWQLFTAEELGSLGFQVSVFGAKGDVKVIRSLRINKVTGETYDAITGQRVRVQGDIPASSAKTIPTVDVHYTHNGVPVPIDEEERKRERKRTFDRFMETRPRHTF